MTAPTQQPASLPAGVSFAGILYGLAAAAIWGAWPVASRFGVASQSLDALDLTALRFGVAGLMLLPIVLRRGHGGIGWPRACVLAFGAGVPYVLVTLYGFGHAPAGHGGLIIPGTMLACTTIGSWLFLKDRPDRARLTGLAAIFAGIAAIGSAGLGDGAAAFPSLPVGHALFVCGGVLWALYTVSSKAWPVDPLHATALVSVISMLVFLPPYVGIKGAAILDAPVSEILFQGLAQGAVSAVLALLCYTRAVAALGPSKAAVFAALVPGLAALFAYPVLGEVPGMAHLIGLAMVVAGMILALGLIRRR